MNPESPEVMRALKQGAEIEQVSEATAAVVEETKDGNLRVEPAIQHHYKVMGFGVERVTVGELDGSEVVEHRLNFLITPIEVVVIKIRDEDKADLVRALTGGVVIPEMRL